MTSGASIESRKSIDGPLALVRAEQARRWRGGERPPAEEFLVRHPDFAADPETAMILVYGEVLLREELDADPGTRVFACGPPPMLEAVRALCAERAVPAQLALESGMACGYGACFGCVVPTREGYVRLCLDGPVLDAGTLESALVAGAGH